MRFENSAYSDTSDKGKTWHLVMNGNAPQRIVTLSDTLRYDEKPQDIDVVLKAKSWKEQIADRNDFPTAPKFNWTLQADDSVAAYVIEINFPDFFAGYYGSWVSLNVDFLCEAQPIGFLIEDGWVFTFNLDSLFDNLTPTRSWAEIDAGTGRILGSFLGRVRRQLPLKAVLTFRFNLDHRLMNKVSELIAVAVVVVGTTTFSLQRRAVRASVSVGDDSGGGPSVCLA